jgi:hypothetical protein
MIKKLLLFAALPFVGISLAVAQCTPDVTITIPGIYPDTLPHAEVGKDYSEVVQFYVPTDSSFNYEGTMVNATVDAVEIDSVDWSGLDSKGFSYACNPGTCSFAGGSNGCLLVSGTAPTTDMVDTFPLTIYLTYHLKIFGTVPFDTAQPITQFSVIIDPEDTSSAIKVVDVSKFQVLQNTPNPFSATTVISFTSPTATTYNFVVYNLLGETVHSRTVTATKGMNKLTFNATNLKEGIYLYSLGNDKAKLVKRMTIAK